MKILNLSHSDGDGLGCNKILEEVFGKDKLDSYFMNYPFLDRQLDTLEKYKFRLESMGNKYSAIFLTDLSFKTEDRAWLEKLKDIFGDITYVYIDHHDSTDMNLKDLFTDFYVDKSGNYAGAGLTFQLFKNQINVSPEKFEQIKLFNKIVDSYDLWKLDSYWELGETFQDIMELFSVYDVKNWDYKMLSDPKSDFVLKELLESIQGKKKFALRQSEENKFTQTINIDGESISVCLFYANNYRNYLAHNISDQVALCVNPTSLGVSFRSKTNKIKVNRFAEQYKGGGHELAGACRLDKHKIFNPEGLLKEFCEFYEKG